MSFSSRARPLCPAAAGVLHRRPLTTRASAHNVAVVGGGFAGLGAAQALTNAGVNVTLIEQGRGLGGRVCSRRANVGDAKVSFDHGAQYLTAKAPAWRALLRDLESAGTVARWGPEGGVNTIGDVGVASDGRVDLTSFSPYGLESKAMYVGTQSMSAVGRRLAEMAGPRLQVVRGTRVVALRRGEGGSNWRLELETRAAPSAVDDSEAAAARALAGGAEFDCVLTAMSANSTRRLLSGVCEAAVRDAAQIKANVCWSLMVAFAKPTGLPFNGALVTSDHAAPAASHPHNDSGAAAPAATPLTPGPCPIAWMARDSSKPGRQLPSSCAETWVVHASPDWSNARGPDAPRREVARDLLAAFLDFARLSEVVADDNVIYLEAHAWSNAYPLNPRVPQPVAGLPGSSGAFVLDAGNRIVACGDWCLGPRVADAWASGQEAAQAALQLVL